MLRLKDQVVTFCCQSCNEILPEQVSDHLYKVQKFADIRYTP